MLRRVIFLWICFPLLAVPLPAHTEPRELPPPSVFYMADYESVWRIDISQKTYEQIFSIQNLPVQTVDSLSDMERIYLNAFREQAEEDAFNFGDFNDEKLQTRLDGMWQLADGRLLFEIDYSLCSQHAAVSCVGYSDFVSFNPEDHKLSAPLLTIDYHYAPLVAREPDLDWTCHVYSGQVIPNPRDNRFLVLLYNSQFCMGQINAGRLWRDTPWTLLVDFRGEQTTVDTITGGEDFTWSPDGMRLAYVSTAHCMEHFACDHIVQITGSSIHAVIPNIEREEQTSILADTPIWLNNETVAFQYWGDNGTEVQPFTGWATHHLPNNETTLSDEWEPQPLWQKGLYLILSGGFDSKFLIMEGGQVIPDPDPYVVELTDVEVVEVEITLPAELQHTFWQAIVPEIAS